MSRSIPAHINPDMLRWARETAHLSLQSAATKLGVDEESLAEWEEGAAAISIARLQNIAESYKRPLAAFFLTERPQVHERVRDFRRFPGSSREWGPNLAAEIRRAENQREGILEVLELREEDPADAWKEPAWGHVELGKAARSLLRHSSLVQQPRPSAQPTEWFFFWSSALEELGVLVVTMSLVKPREARGFSLAVDPVPVIAVNGAEHFNGRIFSLMHEYAHLLLNTSGLCDLHERRRSSDDLDLTEIECNRIAAEILVPAEAFDSRAIVTSTARARGDWSIQELREEAKVWGVSPEVILRRLVDRGKATQEFYDEWRERTPDDAQMMNTRERNSASGGDGLRTKVRNLGKGYVRMIVGAHQEGLLTTYETANLLNSKVEHIPKLLDRARVPEGL